MAASVLAVAAGLGTGGYIAWFYWHSDHVGGNLIKKEQATIKDDARKGGSCQASAPPGATITASDPAPSSLLGLISAPSIDLRAPVVEGVDDAQLQVAVGHLPASAMPGGPGTGVLSAHDVTWFSQIDRLRPGDELLFEQPCSTLRYRVEGGKVVKAGAPIYTSSASKLALVTCYPLNALFVTSKRYVITADLVGRTDNGKTSVSAPASLEEAVSVPAPPQLVAEGLTLASNNAPLGTLSFSGHPPAAVTESPLPIQMETKVLELYFAAIRSAEQGRADWWAAIGPGTSLHAAAPFKGSKISHNFALVEPTLQFSGDSFTGATVTSEPALTGGARPGKYSIHMKAQVKGSQLVLTGWSMIRQGAG